MDQLPLHLSEIFVYDVVLLEHLLCHLDVMLDISVNALGDHADGGLGHLTELAVLVDEGFFLDRFVQELDDLGDVLRLVANAFHIGDHLQGGADLPQVTGHRLLLQ